MSLPSQNCLICYVPGVRTPSTYECGKEGVSPFLGVGVPSSHHTRTVESMIPLPVGARVIRRWLPQILPTLTQGSTISIKCTAENCNVLIRSKWRDDGELRLLQSTTTASPVGLKLSQQDDQQTSLGRQESHLLIELINGGVPTIDTIEYDSETNQEGDAQRDELSLTLEIPEKTNIDCNLSRGGSVAIQGKIEGDVRIRVVDGDVTVQKLRGHSIDIQLNGSGNKLYASDLLEAKDLLVRLPSSGRFRAKRIHASSSDIRIKEGENFLIASSKEEKLFDPDDAGAVCDVSSYYITGSSTIDVQCSPGETRQAIRIKSNHGHMTARVSSPMPSNVDVNTHDRLPIADIGGVNGSCEVFVDGTGGVPPDIVSCRVHFDSVASDSVSIIKSNAGSIHMTLDRKVESDLRLLSTSKVDSANIDMLLLDKEDEEFDNLVSMLESLDSTSTLSHIDPIQVQTKAFSSFNHRQIWENVRFVDGWVENKSEEPDSRFDRKLRGETGSVGKINSDGAMNQALRNFQGEAKSSFARPLIICLGSNSILVESLSWLGNVARRYGLDDKREKGDLGRTATRRGRSLDSQYM